MSWSRTAVAVAVSSWLAACGFQPLYAERPDAANVAAELGEIYMVAPKGRSELLLYNELRDRLTPAGEPERPRYRLDLTLTIIKQPLAFARDQTATRQNVTAAAQYALRDRADNSVVVTGAARAIAAYNVVRSEFGTLSAEQDAERRAVKEVGAEIHTRLGVFFQRRGASGS
ncbi:MAG: hypothetical protein FJX61_00680 [Alphaproteobacteria bacterium]|nr:hypothetical protein [Alphaproteobacteria bacterium]